MTYGRAFDYYLSGCVVYNDLDGDGERSADEPAYTTDAYGQFWLPELKEGEVARLEPTDACVDAGTGQPVRIRMASLPRNPSLGDAFGQANTSAVIISPLTQIAVEMMSQANLSVDESADLLTGVLGLRSAMSGRVLLESYDPYADLLSAGGTTDVANDPGSTALSVVSATAQVASLLREVGAVLVASADTSAPNATDLANGTHVREYLETHQAEALALAERNTLVALTASLLNGPAAVLAAAASGDGDGASALSGGGLLSDGSFLAGVLQGARHEHEARCGGSGDADADADADAVTTCNVSLSDEDEEALLEVIGSTMQATADVLTSAMAEAAANGSASAMSVAQTAATASHVAQTTVVDGLLELLAGTAAQREEIVANLTQGHIEALVLATQLPPIPVEPPGPPPAAPPVTPPPEPPEPPPPPAPPLEALGGGAPTDGEAAALTVAGEDLSYVYIGAASVAALLLGCCCCVCGALYFAQRRGLLRQVFSKPSLDRSANYFAREKDVPSPLQGGGGAAAAAARRAGGRAPAPAAGAFDRAELPAAAAAAAGGDRRREGGELRRRRPPGGILPPAPGSDGGASGSGTGSGSSSSCGYGVQAIVEATGLDVPTPPRLTGPRDANGRGGEGGAGGTARALSRLPTAAEAAAEAEAAARRARRLASEARVAEVASNALSVFGADSAVAAVARSAGITQGHSSAVAAVAKAAGLHLEDASPNAGVEAVARAAGLRVDGTPLPERSTPSTSRQTRSQPQQQPQPKRGRLALRCGGGGGGGGADGTGSAPPQRAGSARGEGPGHDERARTPDGRNGRAGTQQRAAAPRTPPAAPRGMRPPPGPPPPGQPMAPMAPNGLRLAPRALDAGFDAGGSADATAPPAATPAAAARTQHPLATAPVAPTSPGGRHRADRRATAWSDAGDWADNLSLHSLSPPQREVAKAQRAKMFGSGGGVGGGACGSAAAAAQSSVEWADALSARGLSPPRREIARAQAARLGVAPPATERDDAPSGS